MNKSKLVTIITPTYNRGNRLQNLYNSLLKQSCYDFKWIIIDDGSTDNTRQRVKEFIQENDKFTIKYYCKKNDGKHRALNFIFEKLDTTLMLIIDSDDYLVENGIEKIKYYWNKYSNESFSTLTFERLFENGKPIAHIKKSEIFEKRDIYPIKYKELGDYSDVYVTQKLINYKFPEFENEKFLSEADMYYYLSENNKSIFINEPLIVGGYKNDGLTKNIRKIQLKNYQGSMYTSTLLMNKKYPLWFRMKQAILYDFIAINGSISLFTALKKSQYPKLTAFSLIPALVYTSIYKMKG